MQLYRKNLSKGVWRQYLQVEPLCKNVVKAYLANLKGDLIQGRKRATWQTLMKMKKRILKKHCKKIPEDESMEEKESSVVMNFMT